MEGSAQGPYPPPSTYEPGEPIAPDYFTFLPLTTLRSSPPAAPSYYIKNVDTLYDLGYELGEHDKYKPGKQDNLVILDYGYPSIMNGEYGVKLTFDPAGTFTPFSDVIDSAIDFAQGYFYGTGTDLISHLRIVISVNNCCDANTVTFFRGHGVGWGETVNGIRSEITFYSSQVDVVGGNDIEIGTETTKPYKTEQWLNFYMAASNCDPGSDNSEEGCFYNFGNLPISIYGTSCASNDSDDWVACDVWYVSWGIQKNGNRFARPLPQIYHGAESRPPWGTDATAWKDLSIFSADQMGTGKMYFVGTLTQRAECGDGCGEGNNYPWEGYELLYNALASDLTTRMSPRWSTDITEQP